MIPKFGRRGDLGGMRVDKIIYIYNIIDICIYFIEEDISREPIMIICIICFLWRYYAATSGTVGK
jgi:hypothetical protein